MRTIFVTVNFIRRWVLFASLFATLRHVKYCQRNGELQITLPLCSLKLFSALLFIADTVIGRSYKMLMRVCWCSPWIYCTCRSTQNKRRCLERDDPSVKRASAAIDVSGNRLPWTHMCRRRLSRGSLNRLWHWHDISILFQKVFSGFVRTKAKKKKRKESVFVIFSQFFCTIRTLVLQVTTWNRDFIGSVAPSDVKEFAPFSRILEILRR